MSANKYTPGPWVIRTAATYRSQIEAITAKGKGDVVARISTPRGGPEASDANAHLIAAAPDMLEALTECLEAFAALGIDATLPVLHARAAIKKARGEP